MSDDVSTKQDLELQMLRMQLAQQSQGGISFSGIQKHWQILAGVGALFALTWQGGQKATEFESRIKRLEESPVKVQQLEVDQRDTRSRVEKLENSLKSLESSMSNIEKSTSFTRAQVDELVSKISRIDERLRK